MYSLEWVRSLDKVELCYSNFLTFCQLYHYNLRFGYRDVKKSIRLSSTDVVGIKKVSVYLKTRSGEDFTQYYYLPDEEAKRFKQIMIDDLEKR